MRLNSPGQFLASSGYFGCQDVTTKADQHPKAGAMASWYAQTEGSSEIATLRVGAPPFSLDYLLVQLQCLSFYCPKMLQSPPPGVGQQVILNCGFECIKTIRVRRLKNDGQTKGKMESHSGKKKSFTNQRVFVPKHCAKTINHDLLHCFRSIIKLANILLFKKKPFVQNPAERCIFLLLL